MTIHYWSKNIKCLINLEANNTSAAQQVPLICTAADLLGFNKAHSQKLEAKPVFNYSFTSIQCFGTAGNNQAVV